MWSNGEGKLTWGRRCLCPLVAAHACSSLLVSTHRCPCPFTFVGGRFRPCAVIFVHARVRGRLSSRVPFSPRCRVTLSMGGGAGHLRLLVVLGPRRHSWLVVSSRRCVVVGWCRHSRLWGGPLTVRGMGARLVCYPVCTIVLGLQTRLVKWGGNDDRLAAHIPQHPHHIRGVGAPLIRYPACTIVLGLQKRLVRWGAMTTGGRSPSPAPRHVCGMGALSVRCPACTFVRCIERCAEEGCQ